VFHDCLHIKQESRIAIVKTPRSQTKRRAASFNGTADCDSRRGGLCHAIVLDNKQHRNIPDSRQVQAFIRQPFAEGAIADDCGDNPTPRYGVSAPTPDPPQCRSFHD
jgi:hypothetical protein